MSDPAPCASALVDGHAGVVRLAPLDGLRGIAALVVALHHVFFHFAPWPYAPAVIGAALQWVQVWGWTLVDLFFLLSGFVFAHVYLTTGELTRPEGRAAFVVARFARLYPLHLTALALFAMAHWHDPANTAGAFVAHLAMLQAFIPQAGISYDWAAWSLSIEAACCAIFLAIAAGSRHTLLRATILFAALGGVLLVLFGSPGSPSVTDMMRRGLFGFFSGQLLWHARTPLARLPRWLLLAAMLAGLVVQVSFTVMPVLPLGLLTWPALLLLALRSRWLATPVLLWLGDRSYAIYLLNLLVITFPFGIGAGELSAPMRAAAELAMIAAVLVLSDLSFRGLERPARRAIRAASGRGRFGDARPAAG